MLFTGKALVKNLSKYSKPFFTTGTADIIDDDKRINAPGSSMKKSDSPARDCIPSTGGFVDRNLLVKSLSAWVNSCSIKQ